MIDWHSHLLPGMDDGSKDIAESTALLKMLSGQGIDTVAATPHFYANDESVPEFLERRQKAYERLRGAADEWKIRILPGAEVRYYPGISKLSGFRQLCIGNSRLLLLEMSSEKWTEYTVREMIEISGAGEVVPVLAHIERYYPMQKPEVWDRLQTAGIRMQVNADYFADWRTRRKALSLLRDGMIHLIGSDCHDLRYRLPHLDKACAVIRKKFGEEYTERLIGYGYSLYEEESADTVSVSGG